MSRQFDQYMEDKFEYQGELKSLIYPTSFSELVSALEIRDTLQAIIDSATREEDPSGYKEMKEQQNDYIQEYLNSIGDFDNSILISNIIYLAKSNGIRLGELEKMLGISTGYISRTAKENTNKRLSIDVVWKIANFFDLGIDDLVNQNLQIPSETSALLCKFIKKLVSQTITGEIEWKCEGGGICDCDPLLLSLPLFSKDDDGTIIYHPEHLNQDLKWTLAGDIYSCDTISEGQKLLIVACQAEKSKYRQYDFIFCSYNEDGTYSWKNAFHTNDPRSSLENYAAVLYEQVSKQLDAVRLAPDIRSIIQAYLQ